MPDLERAARRARIGLRVFRLILYPAVAVVAFLLLAGSKEPPGPRTLHGSTAAGQPVTIVLDGDRPVRFHATAAVNCSRGHGYAQYWRLDNARVPFRLAGDKLTIRETWVNTYDNGWVGHGTTAVDAHRDGDTITGTIWTRQPISGPGPSYVCESGRVTFSARPQR